MKNDISVKDIIQRLKTSLKISSDEKLAELMGVSRPTVTNWKARNSIDYPLIFELFPNLDLNWVIYGVSNHNNPMFKNETFAKTPESADCFKTSDIEIRLLNNEIQTLKEQIREQRQDYIKIISELSKTHEANIKPNSLRAKRLHNTSASQSIGMCYLVFLV